MILYVFSQMVAQVSNVNSARPCNMHPHPFGKWVATRAGIACVPITASARYPGPVDCHAFCYYAFCYVCSASCSVMLRRGDMPPPAQGGHASTCSHVGEGSLHTSRPLPLPGQARRATSSLGPGPQGNQLTRSTATPSPRQTWL